MKKLLYTFLAFGLLFDCSENKENKLNEATEYRNTLKADEDEEDFDEIKNFRYHVVIKKLTDIRDSELAFKSVRGQFTDNWDSLVRFIERDSFTLTQRRDSSVLDKEMTKRYGGVKTYKNIVIIDILGFVSVRDSLFGNDDRYKKMMYVYWNDVHEENIENEKIYDWAKSAESDTIRFELRSGSIDRNGKDIPVFEAMIKKSIILYDQDETLRLTEDLVQGVNGVNGKSLKVGSMYDINTNGNWPKDYPPAKSPPKINNSTKP